MKIVPKHCLSNPTSKIHRETNSNISTNVTGIGETQKNYDLKSTLTKYVDKNLMSLNVCVKSTVKVVQKMSPSSG